jgi:hypothetical protein
MDGRDDKVEPRKQVILEVEGAIGSDLELSAMEETEALGRGRGRRGSGRLLGRIPRR